MMTSILIAIAIRGVFRRNFAFWMSLVISSAIHLVVVHAWTQQVPILSRGVGKLVHRPDSYLFYYEFRLQWEHAESCSRCLAQSDDEGRAGPTGA
ncbi:MAG: hypothetical protein WB660_04415, partial [Candidatus Sulfotelmatobacter sp.]